MTFSYCKIKLCIRIFCLSMPIWLRIWVIYKNTYKNRSMMINNNPYNLPERPPNKTNRIYTEASNNQYRSQPVQPPTPYSQYLARHSNTQQHHIGKPGINIQQNGAYRQPYPPVRNDIKHFLPSPKSQNSSSSNLNNFMNSGTGSRATGNMGASLDKKGSVQGILRQSMGTYDQPQLSPPHPASIKQLTQKIDSLTHNIRSNQKRISQLQKNASIGFLPNNSKLTPNDTDNYSLFNSGQLMNKYQNQWADNFHKLREEIQTIREEVKARGVGTGLSIGKNGDLQRVVAEKCREVIQSSRSSQSTLSNSYKAGSEQLKKQIQVLRGHVQERMKKNFDFLTSVIGRLERELHSCSSSVSTLSTLISPTTTSMHFKPSSIKCSTTAILLRFIECFKVRKHGVKNGEIKITLADTTYYIDNQGYLLDKEQFYLVDSRDCRVRLEEQHLRLLRQEGILL